MSEMIEKLWPAFFTEVSEQLENLELALLSYESTGEVDVDQLFRDFHTIKSSCSMMAFNSMEEIAHASEDLLDLVRADKITINSELCDTLLKAIDCLKQQLEMAGEIKSNPERQAGLVDKIRKHYQGRKSDVENNTVSSKEDTVAEKKTNIDFSENQTIPDDLVNENASNEIIAEYNFEDFSEKVRKELPKIFIVKPIKNQKKIAELAQVKFDIQDEAKKIGFLSINNLLNKLVFPAGKDDEAIRLAQLCLFSEILDRFRYVENISGLDCGTNETSVQLKKNLLKDFGRVTGNLIKEINSFKEEYIKGNKVIEQDLLNRLIIDSDQVIVYAKLFGLSYTIKLLLFVKQVLREIGRNNAEVTSSLLELMSIACSLPAEIDDEEGEDEPYLAICEHTLRELKTAATEGTSADLVIKHQSFVREKIAIKPEFLSILTLQALESLVNAIKQHKTIFEIEADLEASNDLGEGLVSWLSSNGDIISNRTIFHRKKLGDMQVETTKLRFLVAFSIPIEEIKQVLGEMDSDRKLFDLHYCHYNDEAENESPITTNNLNIKKVSFPGSGTTTNDTLRVGSTNLDHFVNQVGELVMLQNMMSHTLYNSQFFDYLNKSQSLLRKLLSSSALVHQDLHELQRIINHFEEYHQKIIQADMRLKGALGQLQEGVMELRVVPVAMVFNRLPRLVRNLSTAQGKKVQIDITGEEVQIDKGMVEILIEPLMHMVRNSIDHGIETIAERKELGKSETAILSLNARQQNGSLIIEIADDGRGLNYEKILQQAIKRGLLKGHGEAPLSEHELGNLIFLPGFSTSDSITETSGRGVGMDVVKTKIVQMGGQIDLLSEAGQGTTFVLRLPLSVAIQGVVLVSSGGQQLAIPERNVSEVLQVSTDKFQLVQGQTVTMLRNMMLPIYRLDKLMDSKSDIVSEQDECLTEKEFEVVVINNGIYRIGLIVDKILERQELFVRDLHPDLGAIPCIGSVSILGDGKVVIILDCENIFDLAAQNAQSLRTLIHA